MDLNKHMGMRLTKRRSALGISQTSLSRSVGVSSQQIQKYEIGKDRISASRIYEFSVLLDVDVSYFYDGLDNGDIEESQREKYKQNTRLVKYFNSIENKEIQSKLISLIRIMSSYDN